MANRNPDKAAGDYYPGYRHPKLLIGYVVWSYHRFQLSLRDVSEQIDEAIDHFTGDGAFDKTPVYEAVLHHSLNADVVIPPHRR